MKITSFYSIICTFCLFLMSCETTQDGLGSQENIEKQYNFINPCYDGELARSTIESKLALLTLEIFNNQNIVSSLLNVKDSGFDSTFEFYSKLGVKELEITKEEAEFISELSNENFDNLISNVVLVANCLNNAKLQIRVSFWSAAWTVTKSAVGLGIGCGLGGAAGCAWAGAMAIDNIIGLTCEIHGC